MATTTFAQRWWDWLHEKSLWEDRFDDLLSDDQEYEKLGTDDYDASLEIHGATNNWRLDAAQQQFLRKAGFRKVYVNHVDGWETHYTFSGEVPVRGWRRRYISDPTAKTDRVISGEPDPGYFEISYWPEGWAGEHCTNWLETGYMRIVPDPLDPFITEPAVNTPAGAGNSPVGEEG